MMFYVQNLKLLFRTSTRTRCAQYIMKAGAKSAPKICLRAHTSITTVLYFEHTVGLSHQQEHHKPQQHYFTTRTRQLWQLSSRGFIISPTIISPITDTIKYCPSCSTGSVYLVSYLLKKSPKPFITHIHVIQNLASPLQQWRFYFNKSRKGMIPRKRHFQKFTTRIKN